MWVHREMDGTWFLPSREDSIVGKTYIDSFILLTDGYWHLLCDKLCEPWHSSAVPSPDDYVATSWLPPLMVCSLSYNWFLPLENSSYTVVGKAWTQQIWVKSKFCHLLHVDHEQVTLLTCKMELRIPTAVGKTKDQPQKLKSSSRLAPSGHWSAMVWTG